jgi:hypothetical protein
VAFNLTGCTVHFQVKVKDKVIAVTDREGPYICEMSRLAHFLDISSQLVVTLSTLRAGSPLPIGRFLVLISIRGWVDLRAIVRLEELGQLKNPMTSGIEPVTFRLVV